MASLGGEWREAGEEGGRAASLPPLTTQGGSVASLGIAVTAGIVLTKGGCNSALAVGGGRESKPWLISNLPTLLYHLIL